jgi:hypothetical protein
MCVLGDKKTPNEKWNFPASSKVVFLSWEEQAGMPYKLIKVILSVNRQQSDYTPIPTSSCFRAFFLFLSCFFSFLPNVCSKVLPWNHFGRKNVGFLYAIHHGLAIPPPAPPSFYLPRFLSLHNLFNSSTTIGAEVIYDTDDDNFLKVRHLE